MGVRSSMRPCKKNGFHAVRGQARGLLQLPWPARLPTDRYTPSSPTSWCHACVNGATVHGPRPTGKRSCMLCTPGPGPWTRCSVCEWWTMVCTIVVECSDIDGMRDQKNALGPCLVPLKLLKSTLYKKKIPRHIKFAVHAWSTKCRRNQKLIAQFDCTLRDESFEPN